MTWKPCPCCTGDKPSHAMISLTDAPSGDTFRVRVPHAARHDSVGWHGHPTVRWKSDTGDEYHGLEIARGPRGVTARDGTGRFHRIGHGFFSEGGKRSPDRDQVEVVMSGRQMREMTKGGPYIGPRGGKWADPEHSQPWRPSDEAGRIDRRMQRESRAASWSRTYTGKAGAVDVRFYRNAAGNPFADAGLGVFYATVGGKAVGYVNTSEPPNGGRQVAFDIEVDPRHRRRGVASTMLRAVREALGREPVPSSHTQGKRASGDAEALVAAMRKAKAKEGQRWITMHPNGKDEKGVPVLIGDNGDGTWSVVGGAGGKLQHLRLHDVKTKEEHAEAAKEKAKEKRSKEKERKKGQTAEQKKEEKASKGDVEAAKLVAEAKFIDTIRNKLGGVDENLDQNARALDSLSDGARNLIATRHHKKLLRQALERKDEMARKLVDEGVERAKDKARAEQHLGQEDPALADHARGLAAMELAARDRDKDERRAERRARRTRQTHGKTDVNKKAADKSLAAIESAPDPSRKLSAFGGGDDALSSDDYKASEEVERRGLKELAAAKTLAHLAKVEDGGKLDDNARETIQKLTGVKTDDDEALAHAAKLEAARRYRRSQMQEARAARFRDIESDDSDHTAHMALAYSDLLGGIATEASAAKKMGLTDTGRVPLRDADIAEMQEVLQDAAELRKKQRAFSAMNKEIEGGDYGAARKAFGVKVDTDTDDVAMTIEDAVRRELAESLRGLAGRKRSSYLQAAAAGKYDALADVGLGIGGQRYIDRPVVDAIGPKNAAMLMRHALEADGHDQKTVLSALESHHIEAVAKDSHAAIERANAAVPGLSHTVKDVGDIEQALAQIDVSKDAIREQQQIVGAALGKMEAMAGMAETFRRKMPDAMVLKGDTGDMQSSLAWLASVGLTRKGTDFAMDYKEGEIHVPRESWDKLLNRIPKEEVARRQHARDVRAGKHDEEGWLPPGIVSRAASTFTAPDPKAPRLRQEVDHGHPDLGKALHDHVGSRIAEGEQPHEILSDLLAPKSVGEAKDPEAYREHVKALFPLIGEDGKATKYQDHAEHFNGIAEKFMADRYGGEHGAFHAQDIGVDSKETHEAVFRALAEQPDAVHAFTPTGQLDHKGAKALRTAFYERQGIKDGVKVSTVTRDNALQALGPEPDPNAGTMSMFGGGGPSPEHRDWQARKKAVLSGHHDKIQAVIDGLNPMAPRHADNVAALEAMQGATGSAWERYVNAHGSLELAQQAMQDEIRGRFVQSFIGHHGKLTGKALRRGVQEVTNRERHVKGTAGPAVAAKLREEAQQMQAKLRERVGGQFAAEGKGAVKAKHTRHLEQSTVMKQNQGALFTARAAPDAAPDAPAKEPGQGERWSLGHRAEAQIASLMPHLGKQFDGKKVGLFGGLNMDGERIHQQRTIRMLDANGGRLLGALGTGSGKSLISIGAFTHQHAQGKATHGVYAVPAAVQGQFGGEMLRYTEPGKYKWATGEGKNHAERVAMLKDTSTHMKVMTHEALRDTLVKLMADHHREGDVAKMKGDLAGAGAQLRADWMRQAMDANDIKPWMFYGDEAHRFTHRGEGPPSALHSVMSAASHPTNASHALFGTATPHKNDEGEVFSMASMVDPETYSDRHAFMQNNGHALGHAPDAVRRELAHRVYSARIPPSGVQRIDSSNPSIENGRKVAGSGPIKLEGEHKARVTKVREMYDRVVKARGTGGVDVEAARHLSPKAFLGQPASQHKAIARRLGPSAGIIRESALRRAINQAPSHQNTKLQRLTEVVGHDLSHGEWTDRAGKTQRGKPSVIFTDSTAEARNIHQHLKSKGVRAALYHGGLNAKEREGVRLGFQPEGGGKPEHDVVVATSAAEAGINMQRAKVIHHYDVPQTEKSHAQRSGRAYRQGQQGDVDVHDWHTDDEYEQQGRRRLRQKAALGAVFQDPITNIDDVGIAGKYQQALAVKHQHREVA